MSDNTDIQKLMELAAQKLDPKEDTKVSDVYLFILEKEIKAGDFGITPSHVYDTYLDWSTNPKSQTLFGREFRKYFGTARRIKHGQPYYMLDPSSFDLSEETILERKAKLRDKHLTEKYGQRKNEEDSKK